MSDPAAAEQARSAKDQNDPAWLAWLTGMDEALAVFFTEDAPGMPEDPYTPEGLRHAEQAAISYFPTSLSPQRPAMRDRADRFSRYIGETFRRRFGGEWVNIVSDGEPHKAVFVPGFSYIEPAEMLSDALWEERDGETWAWVFGNAEKEHADWAANGRLPDAEWLEFKVDRRLAE